MGFLGTAVGCIFAVWAVYSYITRDWKWVYNEHEEAAWAISIVIAIFAWAIVVCPIVLLIFLRPNTETAYHIYRACSLGCFLGSFAVAGANFGTTRLTNDSDVILPGRFSGIFTWFSSVIFFIVMWGWWDSSAWFF